LTRNRKLILKNIYIIVAIAILISVSGCGYKGAPVYVDKQSEHIKK